MSDCRVTIDRMAAADVDQTPAATCESHGRTSSPSGEAAERHQRQHAVRGITDWYSGGVLVTCEWLAASTVQPERDSWHPAPSPTTDRTAQAYEELIEAELLAAERLAMGWPARGWSVGPGGSRASSRR